MHWHFNNTKAVNKLQLFSSTHFHTLSFSFSTCMLPKDQRQRGKNWELPCHFWKSQYLKNIYTKTQKIFRTWCQYPRCPISINLTGQSVCLPLEQFQKLSCPAMTEVGCKRYFSVKLRSYFLRLPQIFHYNIYLLVAAKMISGTSLSTTRLGSTSTWPLRGAATPVMPATY